MKVMLTRTWKKSHMENKKSQRGSAVLITPAGAAGVSRAIQEALALPGFQLLKCPWPVLCGVKLPH